MTGTDGGTRPPAAPPPAVTCVGLVTLDLHQVVDRLPGRNEKVGAGRATLTFGGPAANAAATCALLGGAATLVTGCGHGPVGRLVRSALTDAEVHLVDLAPEQADPAVSSVLVHGPTGERSVVSANATGMELAGARPDLQPRTGCLLVDGHHPSTAAAWAEAARGRGVPVLLDGGSWKPGTDTLLPLVDVAVLSADFRHPTSQDTATHVRSAGCRTVAVSRGGAPIDLWVDGQHLRVPVPPVPAVAMVDTLGAGDVLHGALAFALARGADPVRDAAAALAFAARVASTSCRFPGARGWSQDPRARRDAAGRAAELPAPRVPR